MLSLAARMLWLVFGQDAVGRPNPPVSWNHVCLFQFTIALYWEFETGSYSCPAGSHSAKQTEFITQKRKKKPSEALILHSSIFLPELLTILQLCPLSCPYPSLASPRLMQPAATLLCSRSALLAKAVWICWADMLWSASSSSIFNLRFVFSSSSPKEE